jgi:Mg/Co/Ni transporter MgtE
MNVSDSAEIIFNRLPVVDGQHRLIGIVKHDEIIDILGQEATGDIQKLHQQGDMKVFMIVYPIVLFCAPHG